MTSTTPSVAPPPKVGPVLWHVLLHEPGYMITHFGRLLMFVVALLALRAGVWVVAQRRRASVRATRR